MQLGWRFTAYLTILLIAGSCAAQARAQSRAGSEIVPSPCRKSTDAWWLGTTGLTRAYTIAAGRSSATGEAVTTP